MGEPVDPAVAPEEDAAESVEDFGHPRGTLAVVILFGLFFALSWLGIYIFGFLARGAPQP